MSDVFESKYGKFKELFDPGFKYKTKHDSAVLARDETAKQRLLRPKRVFTSNSKSIEQVVVEKMEPIEGLGTT